MAPQVGCIQGNSDDMTKSGWNVAQTSGTEVHLVGAVWLDESNLGVGSIGRVRE